MTTTADVMRQLATVTADLPEPLNVTIRCSTAQDITIRVQVAYGDAAQWMAADELGGPPVCTFVGDGVAHWESHGCYDDLWLTLTWVQWVRPDEGWDRNAYVGLVAGT